MTYSTQVQQAEIVFQSWKEVPAPQRGELIRLFGDVLRERKEMIAETITKSMFKTIRESRGEVQEAIDMCDFACGLSRQLYGLTMPSERPNHRIQELWLPLGLVGVITAFNFPCAVWAWNFCLAAICGNVVLWKPSEKSPHVALMMQLAWEEACRRAGMEHFKTVSIILPDTLEVGQQLAADPRIALVSATGSVRMGKQVAQVVGARLGKCLLELGGNNAAIVSEKADLDLAVKGCVFGAVGTTGQRCTTLRRAFVHHSVVDVFLEKIVAAYKTIKIGDPMSEDTLIGPLVDGHAHLCMESALNQAVLEGGRKAIVYGGNRLYIGNDQRYYVQPAIIYTPKPLPIAQHETFAPILYVVPYGSFDEALMLVNDVPQGLSSCIFTDSVLESEKFLKTAYTGLVNINTGTSGAEIGGAFGGEKDTGGGRESGSDAWKNYMRRATSTVNFSGTLPLAQGIKFE
jgi:aldehyde dehydrogenase (NAD+)